MLIDELGEEALAKLAQEDLRAAIETRQTLEERKVRSYELYRLWNPKVQGGGKLGEHEGGRGEFGWSKISVPMCFWVVETILPRLALTAPTLIVTAITPEAAPYAKAKQLRLQQQVKRARMRMALFRALKRKILYGLGPMIWWWTPDDARIAVDDISWFDFFLSPDARDWQSADVIWHRTWYTPRQLAQLAKVKGSDGEPMYQNLDRLLGGAEVDAADPLWQERREASGQGPESWPNAESVIPLWSGWYKDGSVVVLGGSDYRELVQSRPSPYQERIPPEARGPNSPTTRPLRPFVCLTNTPDPESPYCISDAEIVDNYQEEISTSRRQALDQMTAHLNAPIVYDRGALGEDASALIDAAFGVPGGKLPVSATDIRQVVQRLSPGQLTQDIPAISELLRSEAQMATGISDYVVGQAQQAGLPATQTATAVMKITEEANMRWRFKEALDEEDMGVGARIVECLDCQFGGHITCAAPSGYQQDPLHKGIKELVPGQLLGITPEANGEGYDYDVCIEAGSLTPAAESEQARDLLQLMQVLSGIPQAATLVDWNEMVREVVETMGYDPERVLLTPAEIAQQQMQAQAQGAAPPGYAPAGPPVPLNGGGGNGTAAPVPPPPTSYSGGPS